MFTRILRDVCSHNRNRCDIRIINTRRYQRLNGNEHLDNDNHPMMKVNYRNPPRLLRQVVEAASSLSTQCLVAVDH